MRSHHLSVPVAISITFIFLLSYRHLTALADNLPLLMGSLKTYQVSACDNEELHLECDERTVINIVVVQYGQPTPHKYMCNNFLSNQIDDEESDSTTRGALKRKTRSSLGKTGLSRAPTDSRKCPEAKHLQYLLLKETERTCREQSKCSLKLTPQTLNLSEDPCANHTKFAEVAYKCRPHTFRNKVVCEGASLKLSCPEPDRIVILSAFYGATIEEVYECPQPKDTKSLVSNCQVNYASEIVMSSCHGKRHCIIDANNSTFGVPTCANRPAKVRYYLKVVHACLAKKMLKADIVDGTTTTTTTTTTSTSTSTTTATSPVSHRDSSSSTTTSITPTKLVDKELSVSTTTHSVQVAPRGEKDWSKWDNSSYEPNTHPLMDSVNSAVLTRSVGTDSNPAGHANCSVLPPSMQVIGFVSDWISAVSFIKKNKERFILYLLVSLFASLVCFLAVLSAKLYHQKASTLRKVREEQAPVTPFEIMDFDDDIDDLDAMPTGGPMDGGAYGMTTHRHYSYHVPQDTPSVSILGPSATEPRPLLYSTLRKKPAMKGHGQYSTVSGEPWSTSSRASASKLVQTQSPSTEYQSPLATLPKSILTNRNSVSSGILKPLTVEAATNTNGDNFNPRSNGYHTLHRPPENETILMESDLSEDPHTQPKSLSKSLNNFYM